MEIERTSVAIFVHTRYRNGRLDEAAKRLRGMWWGKDHYYTFPPETADEITALVDELAVPQTTLSIPTSQPATTPAPAKTGWSKAARRRAGHTTAGHPLGEAVETGDGYTIYEDGAFGGGRVQIWDRS